MVKNPPASARDAGDMGSIPRSGRSPGGDSNSFQYSCLQNSIDRRTWGTPVPGVTQLDTPEHKVHAEADPESTVPGLLVSLEQPSIGPGLYEGSDACSSISFNFCG